MSYVDDRTLCASHQRLPELLTSKLASDDFDQCSGFVYAAPISVPSPRADLNPSKPFRINASILAVIHLLQ